jgi:hypothetical protein
MVEHPDGRRVLVAPSVDLADFVGGVYAFHNTVVCDVFTERSPGHLHFSGGPLTADVTIGKRDALGWALRCVPPVPRHECRLGAIGGPSRPRDDARRANIRAHGDRPRDLRRHRPSPCDRGAGDVGQPGLGPLADIDPPVRFGFSSTPIRPSIVAVATTIRTA